MKRTLPLKNKPEPCPNCGSTNIWVDRFNSLTNEEYEYSFLCKDCGFNVKVGDEDVLGEFECIDDEWGVIDSVYAAWIEVWNAYVIKRADHDFKPCPFCGSNKIKINYTLEDRDKGNYIIPAEYRVFCSNCGANRGSSKTLKDAKERWNYRPNVSN